MSRWTDLRDLAISDEEMWRVWELDMAELRRRGLDTALWAEGERP